MLLVTTDHVPGRPTGKCLGLVLASTVRTRHAGSHIAAGFRTLVGGRVESYEAREEVLKLVEERAAARKADAVLGLRFENTDIGNGLAETCAYGTAVKLQ